MVEIVITAFITALAMTVVHLLAVWSGDKLECLSRPPTSYMVGTTVLGVFYIALLLYWGAPQKYFYGFAATFAAGGTPVVIGHVAKRFKMLREENAELRGGLDELEGRRRMAGPAGQAEGASRKPPWAGGMD